VQAGIGAIVIDSYDEIARLAGFAEHRSATAALPGKGRVPVGGQAHTPEFTATPHEGYHFRYGSFASNSPITDGKLLYAFFGSRGIYALDDVHDRCATHVELHLDLSFATDPPGTLTGILVLCHDWIDQLYIEPTRTGQGIGTQLLDHAKHERPTGLQLWTFASNTRAHRFYERHGFIETRRTDGSSNEERRPDIHYVWIPTTMIVHH